MSAHAIAVFLFTFGGNAVRNLVGIPAYFAIAGVIVAVSVVLFVRLRPADFRWYRLPAPLYWFLGVALLSVAWSQYTAWSAIGAAVQFATTAVAVVLAFVLSWHELLRTLASAFRWLIGLSILFELWVSVFVRHPVVPWWIEPGPDGKFSKLTWWSRDLLFSGGPIQGLLGSSVLFGFLALLALIAFGIQLRAGLVRPVAGWFWVVLAFLCIVLTRSATVWVAFIAVAAALAFALWARRRGPEGRMPVYLTGLALALAGVLSVVFARDTVFGLFGKSSDLTGRIEIWQKVIGHGSQHPWIGWGWVSYWPTWIEPFASLDTKVGLPVPSAHNAWLDVWFQLGLLGVLVFAPLVVLTLLRTWFRAVDQPRRGPGAALPYATSALWPFLMMVALLVQSLTESRILVENGWLLLVILAVKSRVDFRLPSPDTEPAMLPWRRIPIPREAPGAAAVRPDRASR